jgi:hypothetical protein
MNHMPHHPCYLSQSSLSWHGGNLDSRFNFKGSKKRETRFETCPKWTPDALQLLIASF